MTSLYQVNICALEYATMRKEFKIYFVNDHFLDWYVNLFQIGWGFEMLRQKN